MTWVYRKDADNQIVPVSAKHFDQNDYMVFVKSNSFRRLGAIVGDAAHLVVQLVLLWPCLRKVEAYIPSQVMDVSIIACKATWSLKMTDKEKHRLMHEAWKAPKCLRREGACKHILLRRTSWWNLRRSSASLQTGARRFESAFTAMLLQGGERSSHQNVYIVKSLQQMV